MKLPSIPQRGVVRPHHPDGPRRYQAVTNARGQRTTAGTGKSYLWDQASYIANGAAMPVMAAGRDEAETEKRIVMLLLKGLTMWSIDNVNGALEGDFLCQVITQPRIHIRKLGVSEGPEPDMLNSLTPYATGNNIRLVGDMPRRGIISRMDANMERPELRTFETKPHKLIIANRGRYIADCLTIPLAYRLDHAGAARGRSLSTQWVASGRPA